MNNTFKVGDTVRLKAEDKAPNMSVHYLTNSPKRTTQGLNSSSVVYAICQWFNPLTNTFEVDTFHFDELISLG